VFERFTDRARAAVVQAERDALELGHRRLGTEHLLLGLARDGASVGGRALSSLGVTYDDARRRVAAVAPRDATMSSEHVPFSARAKQLLEISSRTALRHAHTRIGTSDLTLSLLGMDGCTALHVLDGLGIDRTPARARVLEILDAAATSSYAPQMSSVRSVRVELSPQTQELARRVLRIGSSYLARRYVSANLVHRASKTVRLIRTLNADPKLRRSVQRRALTLGADADAMSPLVPLSRADCSVCGTLSPTCGTLYTRTDGVLICERCVGEVHEPRTGD
jgi:ATP-dependent Clp protease ATP-binding subunit ClpA